MVQQVGIPDAVHEAQRMQLRRHLARAAETASPLRAPVVARWWSDVASDFSVAELSETAPETAADTAAGTLVLVDALRGGVEDLVHTVGSPSGPTRIVFCEVAGTQGRHLDAAIDPIDVTGVLWRHGLTVIDVDRVPVATQKGVWHVVAGVARRTPKVTPTPHTR